jgi:hypothetical protein
MALKNGGGLNTSQEREFRCYMEGFARGSHSLTYEALRDEGIRYAHEDRVDFNNGSWIEVISLIYGTTFQIMENRR